MLKPRVHQEAAPVALMLSVACLISVQPAPSKAATTAAPKAAATAAASADQTVDKNIASLETKFFSHQYANDPIEKRVERLELLVFGGTQPGDIDQRYSRLKTAMATRSGEHASAGKSAAASGKPFGASTDYPAITGLETKVLKKTYPAEGLSSRLSRLEKKVFGVDNPAMAYADRVDRLKRMVQGMSAAQQPLPPLMTRIPMGPGPKARPRNQTDYFGFGVPNGREDGFFDDPSLGMPGFGAGFPSNLGSMMRQMERQMQQLDSLNLPPGEWTLDPQTGIWVERNSGKHLKPSPPHGGSITPFPTTPTPLPQSPFKMPAPGDNALPPYSDPNSI
jgi:hypothetical protein